VTTVAPSPTPIVIVSLPTATVIVPVMMPPAPPLIIIARFGLRHWGRKQRRRCGADYREEEFSPRSKPLVRRLGHILSPR
jgi:hypothetical protein